MKTKMAILYIRVSTDEQATEGVSLDAQEAKARAWCELNDYHVAGIYTEAMTAKRADNRPALQEALAACSKGSALVVYALSRLARSTRDTLDISDTLQLKGADLVSLSEKIDTTSAAGKMVFRMLAVLAEFERDQLAERTAAAMQHKKANGEVYSRPVYGYDRDGDRLTKNTDEQAVIKTIRRMRSGGMSYHQIANTMTARAEKGEAGYQTKRGGSAWYASTVRGILNNPANAYPSL